MAKKWEFVGKSFCEAAALNLKQGNKHDASNCYIEAGVGYKKVDPQEAVNCYMKGIEIMTDMGRFTTAAKHHMTVAEIYETDIVDLEKAISHFEQAADYFKGEESISASNRCLLNVARYAAQLEQYKKAIDIYEQVGKSCIDNSLLKYSAKEHYFRATLCHMCVDLLNAQLALKKYIEAFPAFEDSRECKLLKKLLEKLEAEDADGFAEAVAEYDSSLKDEKSIEKDDTKFVDSDEEEFIEFESKLLVSSLKNTARTTSEVYSG
ncbi:hypothetical protein RND71_043468 [Anisodus tanguticus]|uniref:Alpha-SNAP n=1 Tax=Anisodus tanguticus TaxID=243964 RepID=A0AAE1QQN0_9SOLA|nr:hypothetical protein RND71_043468 [Anisodus tanguticus]